MSNIGEFQDRVNELVGPNVNFQLDRAHAGKPDHVDLTAVLRDFGVADKVEVDGDGNVGGGSTQLGPYKFNW